MNLDLDPSVADYRGLVEVQLQFSVSTNRFRFHAQELDLGPATLDGQELVLRPEETGIVSATSAVPITPGIHAFAISFTNNYSVDGTGLYKTLFGSAAYIFTQMEPIFARRSFPCWDEPSYKIPWQVSVEVPAELEVVANMPVVQTTVLEKKKRVEFGRSQPMPSYLIALAVGNLASIPIPGQPVPGRVYTVAGQQHLTELAVAEAPRLLRELESYFGIPYPYAKLDHVAVPEFMFGAMENAGLITYKDAFLLLNQAAITYDQRRFQLELIAHEMAHMWFGNLVTMAWWDDLWLNESFATWMSYRIAGRVHPTLRFDIKGYETIAAARAADTQPSVKPIRRAFSGGDNLEEAFDSLSYHKGQAILRMVENWLGEATFRKALQSYFNQHQWGNARSEDLWAAFSETGDAALREILRRYIEQPGMPILTMKRLSQDRLEIRQQRYRTLIGSNVKEQTWHIPVLLRYGDATAEHTFRLVLTNQIGVFQVPGLDQAQWLCPNVNESGYFTWNLPADLMDALANRDGASLATTERLGLLNSATLAVQAGLFGADQWLALLVRMTHDPEAEVQQLAVSGLTSVCQTYLSENERPAYARFLRATLRPLLDRLGFEPKVNEEPQWGPLRASLLLTLGTWGSDPEVVAYCRKAAETQLVQPRNISGALGEATLNVTAYHGDAHFSQRLQTAFETAVEPDLRARFLTALVPFKDPSLARSGLDYLLTEAVRPTEIITALHSANRLEFSRFMFEWIRAHSEAVKDRLPPDFVGFLPFVLTEGDEELIEEGRKFFLDTARTSSLTEVEFKKAAETVALRTALRKKYGTAVGKFVDQFKVNKRP